MKRGDTFVNTNDSSYSHLWIVCIEFDDGAILMFNITSLERAIDATCVIGVGEHPWVRKDSAVEYQRGKLLDARKIGMLKALNCMDPQGAASEALILKILQGALLSPEAARSFKALIEEHLDAEGKREG